MGSDLAGHHCAQGSAYGALVHAPVLKIEKARVVRALLRLCVLAFSLLVYTSDMSLAWLLWLVALLLSRRLARLLLVGRRLLVLIVFFGGVALTLARSVGLRCHDVIPWFVNDKPR